MNKTLLFWVITFNLCASSIAQTTFATKVTINAATGDAPFTIACGLVDGDSFNDIIIGTNFGNTIEVYTNDGDGTFTQQSNVTNTLSSIGGLQLVDLNDDNELDILATGYANDKVTWYAGVGDGSFGTEQTISSSVMGASGIATGTIDAGSTIDVAVTAYNSGAVVWFSNDGTGNFTGPNTIDNTLLGPGSIHLKDIDNDMDLDALITTAQFNGPVDVAEIFRNNGSGVFTKDMTSVTTGKDYIFNATFEDLDGDSNLDILLTEITNTPGAGNFFWIEEDGMGGYTETAITTTIGNPSVAQHKDLDDDGFDDIVLSSGRSGAGNDIVWYKNNGDGTYGSEQVIDDTQSQAYVYCVVDLDNDNDLDIASCAFNQDELNWFENEKYSLSLIDFQSNGIRIFPNPVSDQLFINGLITSKSISLYNVLGKNVLSANYLPSKYLNISQLNSGVYFLKIEGYSNTFKVIKQ